ncbi:hypothetical protein PSHT_16003 [Puccinia striiformis]|uniref:Proteasome activator PA28 C-terminal domain-containing protein n=1 Tax=Puccinia striiformis TaxID=27350 RepID=A0A2S4UBY3_9BASI|nr:hypothetical protein PSHT_16003 [Puccinia striiformis]
MIRARALASPHSHSLHHLVNSCKVTSKLTRSPFHSLAILPPLKFDSDPFTGFFLLLDSSTTVSVIANNSANSLQAPRSTCQHEIQPTDFQFHFCPENFPIRSTKSNQSLPVTPSESRESMSSTPVPYNYEDLMLAPPPAVSQDLWVETTDGKARKALRAVSDDVLARGSLSIQIGLPRKILELTDLIDRSTNDESSIFHEKWDTRWLSQMRSPVSSPTANMSSFSLIGVSTNGMPVKDAVIVGDGSTTTTTTTRRFSISQHGLADISVPSSISVYRPPTHILQLWEFLESQIRHVIELFDAVQMFLILKTPVAEEGNNTGVEIQQQCARTLVDARRFVLGCENYLKLYHSQRAKLASKCIKYPQLEDYQRALVERDHEECRDCRYLLVRLRMQCVAVADVLHKNFDKVNDPKGLSRGGASVGMY